MFSGRRSGSEKSVSLVNGFESELVIMVVITINIIASIITILSINMVLGAMEKLQNVTKDSSQGSKIINWFYSNTCKIHLTFQSIIHSYFSVTESYKCNCKQSNVRQKFQVALSNLIPGVEISFTRTLSATTVSDWKPGQPQLKRVSQVQVQAE